MPATGRTCCSRRRSTAAACRAARAAWICAITTRGSAADGWHHEEIAYAGRRLYASEDDYSGLGALDPNNPNVLYISTDADPVKGTPLISTADGKRHYELFRGDRGANGKWTFTPFTRNSTLRQSAPADPELEGSAGRPSCGCAAPTGESRRVVFVGRRLDHPAAMRAGRERQERRDGQDGGSPRVSQDCEHCCCVERHGFASGDEACPERSRDVDRAHATARRSGAHATSRTAR